MNKNPLPATNETRDLLTQTLIKGASMSSLPLNPTAIQSMNSLQIAELVQSQHRNVKRTIERLAKQGVIQLSPMEKVKNNQSLSANNESKVYVFTGEQGKTDSIIVVAQLCPEFTARLVQRWQELENLVSGSDYQRLVEQNQALQAELLKARPFWSDVIRYKQLGLATHEIAKLTQRGKSTINSHVRMMQQLGFDVANDPQPLQLQMTLGV